jgi:hypothetical protein
MPTTHARRSVVIVSLVATVLVASAALLAARALAPPVARPWACPEDAGADYADLLPRCGKKLYTQYDEELLIRHFFRDRRGGVFVDVGSAHYREGSTTFYLEHHLGWSGVAVDAIPDYGPDYEKYRPATRFFSYLVTDHSGDMKPLFRTERLSQVASASKEWAEQLDAGPAETLLRQTITLEDLLAKAGVTKIDFLSMDIETGEPVALAGFDIEKHHPELVCVELAPPVADRIASYFAAHRYERVRSYYLFDQINGYFKPASDDGGRGSVPSGEGAVFPAVARE